ncbi:MAG TPA: lysylphosphatidylglycerol synthase transmembrane domain-containing protein [Labilithrix sp.]|nr:lysylphosphatidylglycerol synthase transmembrane domain-containing protein [Labilithrix sp.]
MTDGQVLPKRRSPLGTILRAAVGLVILGFVFSRVPLRDLRARFEEVSLVDAGLLLLFGALQILAGAVRWWRLLVRLGERPPFGAVCRDLLVGAFFNTFLPTSFGGDVIRAFRTGRRLTAGYRAWSSSLFERLVGMLTFTVAGALGVLLALGDALPPGQRIVIVGMAIAFTFAMFFASTPLRLLVKVLEQRLPAALVADIRGVVGDLEGPLAKTSTRLETLAWSVLGYSFTLAFTVVCVRALGDAEHTLAVVVGLPIISVLTLLPVSLGGHGLREGLFVVVLGILGVSKDVSLGIALLALACNILYALVGGIVAFFEPTPPVVQTR